jgi:uncharacterized protein (TIGR00661 family)
VLENMRIAYGVHGYSRGHATRALSVAQALSRRHEIQLFAGGDAYDILRGHFPVEHIPSLGFSYREGRRSNWQTFRHNWPRLVELLHGGPSVRAMRESLLRFQPDAVISDAEPWTHAAGRALGVPRIAFDHFGILVHCNVRLPLGDWLKGLFDRCAYRWLMRSPERVLVSSFFKAAARRPGVDVIGPIVREEVRQQKAAAGEHVLAYFNQGLAQLSPSVLEALHGAGTPVLLYGTGRTGESQNISFRPPGINGFLEDLASCRAVVSTAGNQLVGEAMVLGKPLLVVPESTVEQRLNAREVVALGIGEQVAMHQLSAAVIQRFLGRAEGYAERCRREAHDGRAQAVEILERWIAELAERSERLRVGVRQRVPA